MEIRTKIQNQEIRYNISTGFSLEENSFLANAIKQAYAILYNTRIDLKYENDGKIKNFAEAIFGNDNFSILRKNIEAIILKIRGGKLKFLKQKIFEENGAKNINVLASVEKDEDSFIKIYTPFFNTKNFKDDRAGVVIHELAHLCGLEQEKEKFSLESAEALKNFCLLCAGKISLEEINKEKGKKEKFENKSEDELTYRADQPRAPKGQSNGGQWITQDGGNSESSENGKYGNKSDSRNKETPREEKTNSETKKPLTLNEAKDIISEALDMLDGMDGNKGRFNSEEAKELLLGTAIQETDLNPRPQDARMKGGKMVQGDANGLFQMERRTFDDLMNRYLPQKYPEIYDQIKKAFTPAGGKLNHDQLLKDPTFAAIMARMQYRMAKDPLPKVGDIKSQAEYWFKNYNRGNVESKKNQYIDKWEKAHKK